MLPFKLNLLITHPLLTLIALLLSTLTVFFVQFLAGKSRRRVFLVDFACHKPPESQKCSRESVVNRARQHGLSEQNLNFMAKVLQKVGVGDSSYIAKSIMCDPPIFTVEAAREESETVIFGAVDALLAKTKVDCSEIGILIVNCCVFSVLPSLSSIIVNRYKLREDISSYNITGMGCSAGLRAIGLAKQLLEVHPNTCALVVSTENTTGSTYTGTESSKIIANCLFRIGGSATLLSNKPSHRESSKYELLHAVHNQTASSDLSYRSIFREEDAEGHTGVTINKDLLAAAILTIEQHMKTLGALILPLSEQLLYVKNYITRRLSRAKIRPYIPKFSRCAEHFLPHVGGKPVLDELQKNLGFKDAHMEASTMTLHRFGNTSSSSVWYELAYVEAKDRVKKGDRIWHIAFGSGFKCSSVIWRALVDVRGDEKNPWMSDIDDYPVNLDNSGPFPYYFQPAKQQ
ncbi:3-ketoacyl-CoA synthase 11 [Sesamum alatum]|uniref:3-ketoacyl-CoA synthase n=1 Tax=Sesamum alatum TaxID=300844 RepID=A0AAE1Z3P4_9LAMI|nr:3-ketoacyl-CoA synthase 11 [Sesamum alatum]